MSPLIQRRRGQTIAEYVLMFLGTFIIPPIFIWAFWTYAVSPVFGVERPILGQAYLVWAVILVFLGALTLLQRFLDRKR
jgi:hypothetical protein